MDEVVMTVRVPADLARMARSVADSRDETLSQVVRRALRSYVDAAPAQRDLVDVARSAAKRSPAVPAPAGRGRVKGGAR